MVKGKNTKGVAVLRVYDRHSITPSSIGPTFISNFVKMEIFLPTPRGVNVGDTCLRSGGGVPGEQCREVAIALSDMARIVRRLGDDFFSFSPPIF